MEKIEDFFNKISDVIKSNYNITLSALEKCKKEQDIHIDIKLKEIEELWDELNSIDQNISEIKDDNYLNYHLYDEIIEFKYNRLNSFLDYNFKLNLIQMNLNFSENFKEILSSFIQQNYEIDVNYLEFNNQEANIRNILQKDKYWTCICGENQNLLEEIKCSFCERYRKIIETIDCFSDNPTDSYDVLKSFVNRRRKDEYKEYIKLRKDMQKNYEDGEENVFYVDVEWFGNWKDYVMNEAKEFEVDNNYKIDFIKNKGKIFFI